jgi:2,4-dienoyl-CoA reductase-like NADH-dependent reductase (Old Yellow Enzyme family)
LNVGRDLDILFSPCRIGARVAANRFVAQAMEGNDGHRDGSVSEHTAARYLRLAKGGWGIVFVESTSVTYASRGRLHGLVLAEATADHFAQLVGTFKARSPDGLLLVQLTHSGRQSHPATDRVSVCPAPPPDLRVLSTDEIAEIQRQFVDAALLAEKVGFDGIDFKLCHGYLGAEMLRPANTRCDRWGGSFENRTRFATGALGEILARRRSRDFLVGSRISFYEHKSGGCGTAGPASTAYDPTETLALIRLLQGLGLDYINVSGDNADLQDLEGLEGEEQRRHILWYERLTRSLVRQTGGSLAVIGSGYSELRHEAAAIAARRLHAGYTDLVGFGRQTFADPAFPAKVRDGEEADYCARCGSCMRLVLGGRHAGCAVHDPYYKEQLQGLKKDENVAQASHRLAGSAQKLSAAETIDLKADG